ncbi:MAG TPA: hypothetical protein VIN09_03945 [Chloroflexota bacterium]
MVGRSCELALFLVLLFCYSYVVQPAQANALSRYNLVRALVEERTVAVDRYAGNTRDIAWRDSHYYSDKAPGVSILALPAYLSVSAVEAAIGHEFEETHRVYLLTVAAVGAPAALLGVTLWRVLTSLGLGPGSSVLLVLAYGLGTMAWPLSTVFFGHQTAASCAFGAFAALSGARLGRYRHPQRAALVAGLLAGFAALAEYPAALVTTLLFFYTLVAVPGWRGAASYVLGTLPPLLVLSGYHAAAYGAPWRGPGCCLVDPSFAGAREGLNGVRWPDLIVLAHLLLDERGLLAHAPFLALVPVGIALLWRRRRLRPETLLVAAVLTAFLLYNSGYYLPFGGWSPGPRFLLPALPFAMVALAPLAARRLPRLLLVALAGYGVLSAFAATTTATLAPDTVERPLVEVWLPGLAEGRVVHNLGRLLLGLAGFASLAPLLVGGALGALGILGLARAAATEGAPALVGAAPDGGDVGAGRTTRLAGARGITAGDVGRGMAAGVRSLTGVGWASPALLAALWSLLVLPVVVATRGSAVWAQSGSLAVQGFQVAERVVRVGEEQAVAVHLRNGAAPQYNIAFRLEVVDGAGGRLERWFYPVNLRPEERRALRFTWEVPDDGSPGARLAKVTIFHPGLARVIAETPSVPFEVRRPSTPRQPAGG